MAIAASLPEAPHWPQSAYLDALNPESTPRRIALVAAGSGSRRGVQGFAVASLVAAAGRAGNDRRGQPEASGRHGQQLFHALAAELHKAGVRRAPP